MEAVLGRLLERIYGAETGGKVHAELPARS
jgi:hypothetical protein